MTNAKCSLLVVDDEPHVLSTLSALLSDEFEVMTAPSPEAAQLQFTHREFDIILTDQKMPRMSGVALLEWVRTYQPKTVRLLMTGYAELEDAVEAINRGQVFRYIFKPWRGDELLESLRLAGRTFMLERANEKLLGELRQMNVELESRVAQRTGELEKVNHELKKVVQELEQTKTMFETLSLTDDLTSLPNRRRIDQLAEHELSRRDRYPTPLSLGLIDVDKFKEINDRHLHPAGDKILVDLAKVLNSSRRSVDHIGRVGGEEFLVIAPETNMEGAMGLGERLRTTVEKTVFTYEEDIIPVRVSIGFAVAGEGTAPAYDQMKYVAAAALSEAKLKGRNRCVFYPFGSGC